MRQHSVKINKRAVKEALLFIPALCLAANDDLVALII